MKYLIPALVFMAAVAGAPALEARQTDTRLDGLFARLHATDNDAEAAGIEAMIWGIWTAAEDEALDRLMRDGVGAMNSGRFGQALESFNAIIESDPSFAEGWNKRATVNYLLGNYPGSLYDIERTLNLEPRHFGALSGRGLVLIELDQQGRALESFEAALEVYPKLPGASRNAESLRREIQKHEI